MTINNLKVYCFRVGCVPWGIGFFNTNPTYPLKSRLFGRFPTRGSKYTEYLINKTTNIEMQNILKVRLWPYDRRQFPEIKFQLSRHFFLRLLRLNEELPKEREFVFYTKAVEIVFEHLSNKSKYHVCILIAKNVIYLPKSLVIS